MRVYLITRPSSLSACFQQAWDGLIEKRVTVFEKILAGIGGSISGSNVHKIVLTLIDYFLGLTSYFI